MDVLALNVLIVEDSEYDVKMLLHELRRGGYTVTYECVETPEQMSASLKNKQWDIILSDYSMPEFDGLSALHLIQDLKLDIPFIIVSGSIGEELAVEAMKAGAHDYLMKENLSRLVPAVARELREAEIRRERREAEKALQRAYEELEMRVEKRTLELATTNQKLQEAINARDQFISIAAHELKTPVTSMRGFAQSLLRQLDKMGTVDPERLRRSIEMIEQQSGKLAQFIEQLMDASRLEGGRITLELQPVDIVQLVRDAAVAAQMGANTHQINIQSPTSLIVHVDVLRIEQVISNLINNAIKYSPEAKKIDIDISTSSKTVRVAVRDYGIGIPVEHRAHIFKRFYQGHGKGYLGGMGLGLYVSQEIIQLHGGKIEAEFPDGDGTCFVVYLPINPLS
jgi:signal transduction histidine kinase